MAQLSDDRGFGAFVNVPLPTADFVCVSAGVATIGAGFSRVYYNAAGQITEQLYSNGSLSASAAGRSTSRR